MEELIQAEVLILGCGIAGSVTALRLADQGVPVLILTRASETEESNTYHAQGGIIYKGKDDSPSLLIEDIRRAGAGICNLNAATILAKEGPSLIESVLINRCEVVFDRDEKGDLLLALEGGHSLPRIVHTKDATGKTIALSLLKALREHPNIRILTGHTAVDLLTTTHQSRNRLVRVYEPPKCLGVYAFDQASGSVRRILAKATVLATGGVGRLYLWTTNPTGARGDGLAMALRAGARTAHLEFVQFHPTTLFHPKSPGLLISEAVRGAGARLLNDKGEAFMASYDPTWKDLSPRDVVARAIHEEMLRLGSPCVWLDLAGMISREAILEKFPTIHAKCLELGIEITQEPIPVVPAAHYHCGGVLVDGLGRTSLQGLYAVGEVSCTGLHGANRLASTSLLEGLVWGYRTAGDILESLTGAKPLLSEEIPSWAGTGLYETDSALITQDMSVIRHILWNYVGLVRTTPRLERAQRELEHLQTEIERFYRKAKLSDSLIGLRNAAFAAKAITQAAWENKTSIGCHYRAS
jgi:L-aspartate oxidase